MTVDRYLRMFAGFFVLLSLALGYWVSPKWYFFTAFVGLNLFQSAFTNWCPAMSILKFLGAPNCRHEGKAQSQAAGS
jgi:hypothetical protein